MNKSKRSNIIEDYTNFSKKIKKFKLFLIKFNKNSTMKSKIYFLNYIIKNKDY